MKSKVTATYWKRLQRLPPLVRRAARRAYRQFNSDPHHKSLRFKKLNTRLPLWSARINRDYRAVGVMDDDTIVWFWIGTHDEYDELLKQV
ncbi:MAG: hypothetical protein AAGG46_05170 [Planctomycetota bacterium]